MNDLVLCLCMIWLYATVQWQLWQISKIIDHNARSCTGAYEELNALKSNGNR